MSAAASVAPSALDLPIAVTTLRGLTADTKHEERVSLRELARRAKTITAPTKHDLPLVKLATFGDLCSKPRKEGGRGSLRHDRNLLTISGVEGDYDGGVMPMEQAAELLEMHDVAAVLYTSPSHVPEKPRYRILSPCSCAHSPGDRAKLLARIDALLGSASAGILSRESYTKSQSYYLGNTGSVEVITVDGVAIDQARSLAGIGDALDAARRSKRRGGQESATPEDDGIDLTAVVQPELLNRMLRSLTQSKQGEKYHDLNRVAYHVGGVRHKLTELTDEEIAEATLGALRKCGSAIDSEEMAINTALNALADGAEAPLSIVSTLRAYGLGPVGEAFVGIAVEPTHKAGPTCNTVRSWTERTDVAPPRLLLGNVAHDSGRCLIVGPTGVGKSQVMAAKAAAIASGEDFMHWKGSGEPCDVLLIDGEMSRDLLVERMRDVRRRHPNCIDRLHLLSIEDFDFAPLNTADGRQFVLKKYEELKPRAVFLDNAMSLLDGDLKDEMTWKGLQPLTTALTTRRTFQCLATHTGHDASHAYGSKTQEWRLDSSILLSEVPRNGAELAMGLTFTKSRRRTSVTWSDFAAGTARLVNDKWQWTEAPTNGGARKTVAAVPRQLQVAHETFRAACILNGSANRCERKTFREICVEREVVEASNFNKLVSRMVGAKLILSEQNGQTLIDRQTTGLLE
jgi:hypothetical protein